MSELIRAAKSASDWTYNELAAYNICVRRVSPETFFGSEPVPPQGPRELLDARGPSQATDLGIIALLRLMESAMDEDEGEETAVDDFAMALFSQIGYISLSRMGRSRKPIRLYICGEERSAQTDVCLIGEGRILLLVQENKSIVSGRRPEPQLVAEAVGAYQHNCRVHELQYGTPPPESQVIPGITMVGTFPTFYKIPVTQHLSKSLMSGTYPRRPTMIETCTPSLGDRPLSGALGMLDLSNRGVILGYFESFKQFIDQPRPAPECRDVRTDT